MRPDATNKCARVPKDCGRYLVEICRVLGQRCCDLFPTRRRGLGAEQHTDVTNAVLIGHVQRTTRCGEGALIKRIPFEYAATRQMNAVVVRREPHSDCAVENGVKKTG